MRLKQRPPVSGFTLLSIAFALVAGGSIGAQQPTLQREINIVPLNLHAPIQVSAVGNSAASVSVPRGPHQVVHLTTTNSNWLTHISMIVDNHSAKDIVAIEARVSVGDWEENPERPKKFIKFHEGQFPNHALKGADGGTLDQEASSVLDIKPGTSADIPLTQASTKLMQHFSDQPIPLAGAQSVWIQIERVFFADGTMWEFNAYLKPDDSTPGAYTRVTPEEWAQPLSN